jgi:hypothetical protein
MCRKTTHRRTLEVALHHAAASVGGEGGGREPLVYSNKEGQDSNNATRVSSLNDTSDFPTAPKPKATLQLYLKDEFRLWHSKPVINMKTEQHVR